MTLQRISESVWAGFGGIGRNAGFVRLGEGIPGLLAGTSEYDVATVAVVQAARGTVGTVVAPDAGAYRISVPPGARVVATPAAATEIAGRALLSDVAVPPGSPLAAYLTEPRLAVGLPGARWSADVMISGWWSPVVGTDNVVVLDVGRGYSAGDCVVWLAGEATLLAGALIVNGVHPASWSGSLIGWHAACARLADLQPATVLPGYGRPGGGSLVTGMRDYLEHLRTEAESRYRKGMPVEDAATDLPLDRWSDWACPEHLVITLTTAYRELGAEGDRTIGDMLTTVAEMATGIRCRPRIAPLAPGERDAAIADALRDPHMSNIQSTLARHPSLYEHSVSIARDVVSGVLPARDREMVILRGAWACAAAYQWNHHHPLALAAGLTEAEIDLLSQPVAAGDWTPHERAILSAVDELNADAVVSDATWTVLSRTYGERELIELVTLIGEYHKISFQLNSWGVPLEHWIGHYHLPSGWRRTVAVQQQRRRPPDSAMTLSGLLPVAKPDAGAVDGRHSAGTAHGSSVADLMRGTPARGAA